MVVKCFHCGPVVKIIPRPKLALDPEVSLFNLQYAVQVKRISQVEFQNLTAANMVTAHGGHDYYYYHYYLSI